MKGDERRQKIIEAMKSRPDPLSGAALARMLGVSRQVIVQDMALLRVAGVHILSTNRGYLLQQTHNPACCRIFKVRHSDDTTRDELNTIVDMGGTVVNVIVSHRVYGRIEVPLNVCSRKKVDDFMQAIRSGKSSLLKNVTSGYHYHKVEAESGEVLDQIEDELIRKNYLIEVVDKI